MTRKLKILVRYWRVVCIEWMLPVVDLLLLVQCCTDYSASIGSEEESGKDWDELEEEARKGMDPVCRCYYFSFVQLVW